MKDARRASRSMPAIAGASLSPALRQRRHGLPGMPWHASTLALRVTQASSFRPHPVAGNTRRRRIWIHAPIQWTRAHDEREENKPRYQHTADEYEGEEAVTRSAMMLIIMGLRTRTSMMICSDDEHSGDEYEIDNLYADYNHIMWHLTRREAA